MIKRSVKIWHNRVKKSIPVVLLCMASNAALSQDQGSEIASNDIAALKKLSIEELMNVEVNLLTKQPKKLESIPAALDVITGEDIRRSAAQRLPEALRLLPNVKVSHINGPHYTVNARGFNASFANKMLVMIDGRTVYSPLFAGVFWDVQNLLLEDVARIEAISGPGGSLWGANAVNGLINVVSKHSKATQGLYITEAHGTFLNQHRAGRYGGKIGDKITYRVFAQHYDYNPTHYKITNPSGKSERFSNGDDWKITQAGFRMDIDPSDEDQIFVQGNYYKGKQFSFPEESTFDGQSLLARWNHKINGTSDIKIQAYFDRTWRRDIPSTISDQLHTTDVDIQYHNKIDKWNNILVGAGYRYMDNLTLNNPAAGIFPKNKYMPLYTAFVQDEISLLPEFTITIGSKFLHNVYTGFEIQPSLRLAYNKPNSTLWAAISRAVRTPSRFDTDYYIPPYVMGGPDFVSEKLVAYELGYRRQMSDQFSMSVATFYNNYNDLYSVGMSAVEYPGPVQHPYVIMNGTEGYSTGLEFSGIVRAFKMWRLRGGYTFFYKDLWNGDYDHRYLGFDPKHQIMVHSMLDLPANFQLDLSSRYVSKLQRSEVPEYFATDVEIAWLSGNFEFSVTGKNLFTEDHLEFIGNEIPRSILGRVTWRY